MSDFLNGYLGERLVTLVKRPEGRVLRVFEGVSSPLINPEDQSTTFDWGRSANGLPLAHAILLTHLQDQALALSVRKDFYDQVVSSFRDSWTLSDTNLTQWLTDYSLTSLASRPRLLRFLWHVSSDGFVTAVLAGSKEQALDKIMRLHSNMGIKVSNYQVQSASAGFRDWIVGLNMPPLV